jgi:hypothetical protein
MNRFGGERLSSRGRTQLRYTQVLDEKLAYSARVQRFVRRRLTRTAEIVKKKTKQQQDYYATRHNHNPVEFRDLLLSRDRLFLQREGLLRHLTIFCKVFPLHVAYFG